MVWTKRSDPFGIKTLLLNKIPMQKVDCKHRIYYEVYSAHHKINKKSSNYWLSQPTPLTNNCLPANWLLWYVSRKAIFGAGMGRDDGYYCGVLSSGVNLFLVEGSSFYSIHSSFIVRGLLAASRQLLYQVTYTIAHVVANTRHLQSSYILCNSETKDEDRTTRVSFHIKRISNGCVWCRHIVLCSIVIITNVDRLWMTEDLCHSIQHADTKGNHFIDNW